MFEKPHKDAELEEINGLEFWRWKEGEVLKIELTGKGSYSDVEVEKKFKGKFVEEEDLAIVFNENVDVYAPPEILDMFSNDVNLEDRIIVSFRKKVIPEQISRTAYENLKDGAAMTDNRGTASGPVDPKKMPAFMTKYGDLVFKGSNTNRAFYRLADGSVSTVSRANFVNSGQCGYFGPNMRFPFARKAGMSKTHQDKVDLATPYFEQVSKHFKTLAPSVWQRQYDFLNEHDLIKNGWTLGDSVYTTITINKNFQTACHQDAGDYSGGLGNITVLENYEKPFTGGYVSFPQWRCGVDLREGDILVFAIHQYHGNTKIKPPKGVPELDENGEETFERMSLVCYARENMKNAGTKEQEAKRQAEWKSKFKSSNKMNAENLQKNALAEEQADKDIQALNDLFDNGE